MVASIKQHECFISYICASLYSLMDRTESVYQTTLMNCAENLVSTFTCCSVNVTNKFMGEVPFTPVSPSSPNSLLLSDFVLIYFVVNHKEHIFQYVMIHFEFHLFFNISDMSINFSFFKHHTMRPVNFNFTRVLNC
ncbi:hypothetical protein CHS0354_041759 [Potamilus streckersoni]|uniref:Uncharacterized protein n=1 Tax=Potamilus streckersoni TaxID=2493646 RepID=A0AAE0T291_9BIVA|nr:hypothetical protein CHS0354_041759 [Potamilus streckersoni]